jgi:hypothetical protein
LSLPVGSSVLLDCKLVKTAQTSALDGYGINIY